MPDASPTRWHLAHTTWFFETFVLMRNRADYAPWSADYQYLFNSYYNTIGEQFPRDRRGLLTRPTVAEIFAYRKAIDERMGLLLESGIDAETAAVVEIGIQHEQQHQELILTDLKYLLGCNPLFPAYRTADQTSTNAIPPAAHWLRFAGGIAALGHEGAAFAYDNERPRHQVLLQPFELEDRLVTSGEYLEFVDDGGYTRPELWLSLGWATVRREAWTAPLYWIRRDGELHEFTLAGLRPLEREAPVTHVSFFEADAFARWRGVRLPTEAEWEHAAARAPLDGGFSDARRFHPVATGETRDVGTQWFGETWQWTQSPYTPYPGYAAPPGALGEYNGKFMCNQYVLRGGSCATPASHIRPTYRNFFPPETRWQFSGIRLARDVAAERRKP
jgi:ergothioneine biosynthesis protein EgtB